MTEYALQESNRHWNILMSTNITLSRTLYYV
jgi:hypothetical protein